MGIFHQESSSRCVGLIREMDRESANQPPISRALVWWLVGLGVFFLLSLAIGWFDNTTQLSPSRDSVLTVCLAIASLSGLVFGIIVVRNSKEMPVWRRAGLSLFGLVGFIAAFQMVTSTTNIALGWIDFPPNKTKTYPTKMSISRAYQTHGKGRSWNIQTTPIWSYLDITEDDYKFMLTHRPPADRSSDPDEISSEGYFCAKVTVQQSGAATRILYAGTHKLPKGTVVICSSRTDE